MPAYTRDDAAAAVAHSLSYAETLRELGLRPAGGNHRTLRTHLERWGISTDHFDPNAGKRRSGRLRATPLTDILVEHSTFSRGHLKERLYASGLKRPQCELCGQGPEWQGNEMALVLDHVNGVGDDNRLENLRIVCPNCAATLDTHCGRNLTLRGERKCANCQKLYRPKTVRQRYCSQVCGRTWGSGRERPEFRKVPRPSHADLLHELNEFGFTGTARRHGVSDNAVRKWLIAYERTAVERSAA